MKKAVFIAILIFVGIACRAENRSRTFKKNFPASAVKELRVWNRFGNIDVRQEGNEFEIEAVIAMEGKSGAKLDELLKYIYIQVQEEGEVLDVKTVFEKGMSMLQRVSSVIVNVDYHIKVPVGKNVKLEVEDGNILLGDFVGNLSVGSVSGNFKAHSVKEGVFMVNFSKGDFEIEELTQLKGEFKSAKVKIGGGKEVKLNCTSTTLQLMEADHLNLKTSGGTCFLGMIDCLTAESFYTKYEIQDIGDSLQMKTRWGEVNIRNIHFSFAAVEIKSSSTKLGLTFGEGAGYDLSLKYNRGVKVDLPESFQLETQPVTEKNIIWRKGAVGDKKYDSKVVLELSGGNLFIQ